MANINKVALLNNGKVVGAGRNKDNSNLAPIEATTTASRSYLVGDYLMLQGEFYKVIQAISIGNALVVGTNIQATSVGDEVSDINERINANTFGTDVTLTYDTDYITLSDGYFRIYIPSGTNYAQGSVNGQVMIKISATSSQSAIGTIFVKKGMTIKYMATSSSANAQGRFFPLL